MYSFPQGHISSRERGKMGTLLTEEGPHIDPSFSSPHLALSSRPLCGEVCLTIVPGPEERSIGWKKSVTVSLIAQWPGFGWFVPRSYCYLNTVLMILFALEEEKKDS